MHKAKYNIKRRYKLTMQAHRDFLKRHRYRCGICKTTDDICIDHDHKTDELRGLLCRRCNLALGIFKDDVKLLRAALAYLAR